MKHLFERAKELESIVNSCLIDEHGLLRDWLQTSFILYLIGFLYIPLF